MNDMSWTTSQLRPSIAMKKCTSTVSSSLEFPKEVGIQISWEIFTLLKMGS